MTHEEMIENMCKKCGPNIPKTAIEQAFKQVFSNIKDACASGDTIIIHTFGTFYMEDYQKRKGKNISLPANKKISFKKSAASTDSLQNKTRTSS